MSFCPSDDIHSVYLDGELPEEFKFEYESHLKNCPECAKKVEKLRKLNQLLAQDSKEVSVDQHYLDQSFDRLMVKMTYEKNVKSTKKISKSPVFYKNIKYIGIGAAAALIFALIIPIRLNENSKLVAKAIQKSQNVALQSQNLNNNVEFDSGRSVVISGNIDKSALASVNVENPHSAYVQNVSTARNSNAVNMMDDVNVFKPDLNEGGAIYIKVTVPGMNAVKVYP